MLMLFAGQWNVLLFRGGCAIVFGMLALFLPGLTLAALVLLFGAYVFLDGIAALITAVKLRGQRGFWSLLLEALAGLGTGVVSFLNPAITALAFLIVIAAWAILLGIAALLSAIALRKELKGEWPLPVAGALSLLLGLLLLLQPSAGALALVWLVGSYALLFGGVLLTLAIRMRHLSHEIAIA